MDALCASFSAKAAVSSCRGVVSLRAARNAAAPAPPARLQVSAKQASPLSTKKRIRQDAKKRVENKSKVSEARTYIKKSFAGFSAASFFADAERLAEAQTSMDKSFQKIDKLVKHNLMHKNTAARRKARLSRARAAAAEAVAAGPASE